MVPFNSARISTGPTSGMPLCWQTDRSSAAPPKEGDKVFGLTLKRCRKGLIALALLATFSSSLSVMAAKFDPEMAKFVVKFKGDILPYEVMSVTVLPAEKLVFELPLGPSEYEVKVPQGTVARIGTDKWEWKAPAEKGLYPVKFSNKGLDDSVTLKVFVMVPYN